MKFNESHLHMDSTQVKLIELILSILPGKFDLFYITELSSMLFILIFFHSPNSFKRMT